MSDDEMEFWQLGVQGLAKSIDEKMISYYKNMTQCGLCKDCRWWDKQATIKVETWGRCVNQLKRFAVANTSTLGFPSKHEEMVTSRNFGCIQFEPKTEEG